MIRSVFVAALLATFAVGSAMAQESCDSKAMGKDGKPLAGAAKTSFMKKCMADSCAIAEPTAKVASNAATNTVRIIFLSFTAGIAFTAPMPRS